VTPRGAERPDFGTGESRPQSSILRRAQIVRRRRWLRRRPPPRGSRGRAAFTIVRNEAELLPLWLAHYRRFFEKDDLYVLDHDSTDGSTQAVAGAMLHTVERFQSFLLASYETVLFAEVDEFIVADPARYAGLDSYIEQLREPAACCTGFNVVHYPPEPPLRLDRPILRQRRFWHRCAGYSKRLIAKAPLEWGPGFHFEYRFPRIAPDPDLYLVHLHRADYERCLSRHRAAAASNWSEADVAAGWGAHHRIVDTVEFRHWFFNIDVGAPDPEPIPDRLKSSL
jgi:hypothetical protein